MNIKFYTIYTLFLMFLASSCSQNALEQERNDQVTAQIVNSSKNAVKGEILIKFTPEISKLLDEAIANNELNVPMTRSGINTVDELLAVIGTYEVERIFPIDRDAEEKTRHNGLHLWYMVKFDESENLDNVAEKLSQLGEIAKIEFNHTIKRNSGIKSFPLSTLPAKSMVLSNAKFNDPDLAKQWNYINTGDPAFMPRTVAGADVNCKGAWEKCAGDPSIIVAILDEGVQWNHPDIQANMWTNEDEEYKSFKDNDGNGYEGDYFGYNFSRGTGVITWADRNDTGHGTHVAGTIAAVNNNGAGVCGIAGGDGSTNSGVKIMSLQTFSGNYGVSASAQAKAIQYAADNGAVILQCSWGYISSESNQIYYPVLGPATDEEYEAAAPLMKEAFDYFIYNAGSPNGPIEGGIVVFASGNENAPAAAYPAKFGDYISVSAMTGDFTPTSYTNFGAGCDITAPGGESDYHTSAYGDILSTLPTHLGSYGYMQGTSMACPHVAGVAALGLAYAAKNNKHFKSSQYKDLILSSTQSIDEHLVGEKLFHYQWGGIGDTHPSLVDVAAKYRGKMGSGVINADLLLSNIIEQGSDLILSNVYVKVGGTQELNLNTFFKGEGTYTVSVTDQSIAEATVNGSVLKISGTIVGRTEYTVTSSSGESQKAYITVRDSANNNGWL